MINEKLLHESMTAKEVLFKYNVIKFLREDGFNTFANYLNKFHFNFVEQLKPGEPFIAAVVPDKGIILINPKVNSDNISLLLRHEVGHVVMKHMEHFFHKLKQMGINTPSEFAHEFSNRVGDYQISNEIYDDTDKKMAKKIKIDGFDEELKGLVTELDFPEHPEYWHMDFDQLWDALVKNYDITKKDLEQQIWGADKSQDYVDGWNEFVDKYNKGEITIDEIKEWMNGLKEDLKSTLSSLKGDKSQGFKDALNKAAMSLLGGGRSLPKGMSAPKVQKDPRLKDIPNLNPKGQKGEETDSEEEKSQKQKSGQGEEKKEKELPSVSKPLSKEELNDLVDKIKQARNSAEDVIDDADNKINQSEAEKALDELDELEKEARKAKAQSDANKIKARLDSIADFWEDPKNQEKAKKDKINRDTYRKLSKELTKARFNALKRNYNYKPMNIKEIVNNIVHTIKNATTKKRDSSWARYNARSDDLGYYAPGRYNREIQNVPNVVFYFDVSGSWSGNKEKIDMGHRIEEALKVLDKQGRIHLSCFYFGTTVHTEFTTRDGGNSNAPIPHAIDLCNKGKLDNVIIMTDSDPSCDLKLEVPGYAWLLFYDSVSESLADNVSGQKGTKIAMIEHDEKE